MPEVVAILRRHVGRLLLITAALASLPAQAILNGQPAQDEPAVAASTVAIVIEDRSKPGPDGRPGYYPSSGIVVAPNWILTVRHAFVEFNGPQHAWQVHLLPEVRRTAGSRILSLNRSNVFLHPTLDLALIRLDQPLPFDYRPARLVSDGRRIARAPVLIGLLAGYGPDGERSPQNLLRFVQAPISALSLQEGRRWPDSVPRNQGASYLEVDQRDGRGSCRGDSGGPVFARLADGSLGVVAVIHGNASYDGAHPCLGYAYAVRVDHALAWLTRVTGRIYNPASMLLVEANADDGSHRQ